MKTEKIIIPLANGENVSGILSVPDSGPGATGIIIAHGAGGDMNNPMLLHLSGGLADAGYTALLFNFLYREKGKRSPDKPELLYLAWNGAYRFLETHPEYRPDRIMAAGKSLGGRIASQMAADGNLPVERLIFLGYPLHPPGKKDRIRDSHLYKIQIPMIFFAGTRDQLCDLELLKGVLSRLQD